MFSFTNVLTKMLQQIITRRGIVMRGLKTTRFVHVDVIQ